MARKRGSRFRTTCDAQRQLEGIEKGQQQRREAIRSIEKSKKRLKNSFTRIRSVKDLLDEFP